MSTVAEIKAAIDKLSPRERCELNALTRAAGMKTNGTGKWLLIHFREASWTNFERPPKQMGTWVLLPPDAFES